MRKLRTDLFHIFPDLLDGDEVALLTFAGGIPNQAGSAPRYGYGAMSRPLDPAQGHERDEVPHVEAVRRRVEPHVNRRPLLLKKFLQFRRMAAPLHETAFL
jgi:hypothetical protein